MNYIPMDSGGVSASYLAFHDGVQTKLDHVKARIESAMSDVRKKFDAGPLAGLLPVAGLASSHVLDQLELEFEKIWDAFTDASIKIWDRAGQLTGDPDALMDLNQYYYAAAARLTDERQAIQRIVRSVSKHWEGNAFVSFEGLAGEQCDAIDAICAGLRDAATACSNSSDELTAIRNDVLVAIFDLADKVAHEIDECFDVGKILTLEAGPAIEAVANVATAVGRLCTHFGSYYAHDVTAGIDAWRRLNGGLPGLTANNDWPTLGVDDVGDMEDHTEWTPT